jgi:hypothetical protein
MKQSRIMSFIEANANAVIGLIVSWLFTYFALPLFGLEPSAGEAVVITFCYFMLSVGRSYLIRRWFNGQ